MSQVVNFATCRITESQIVAELTKYLKTENYNVRCEVPSCSQSVDLVLTRGRWVTFLEVKVHDWKRAIYQCQAHEQVADYLCIAVATLNVSSNAVSAMEIRGYGLLHRQITGEYKWILKPKRNLLKWKPPRRRLAAVLKEISYVR